MDTIYLCGDDFQIPRGKKNITYIGIQTVLTLTEEQREQCEKNGIRFIGLLKEEASGQEDEDSRLLCICTSEGEEKQDLLIYESNECQEYRTQGNESEPFLYNIFESYKKDLHVEFQKEFVEIPIKSMAKIRSASFAGRKILYAGENGQGAFLGIRNVDGTQDRVIRYFPNSEDWQELLFCRDYVIMSKKKTFMGDRTYFKIDVTGLETEIEGNLDDFFNLNVCEARNGVYSIDGTVFCDENSHEIERGFVVKELLCGENKVRRYQFKIDTRIGPGDLGKLKAVYSNRNLDKVYFLWGSQFESDAQIWFFDTNTKQIAQATPMKIGNFDELFGVNGDEIFYHGSESKHSNLEIMSLNMVTGKKRCVWENLSDKLCGPSGRLRGMLKGDYLYLCRFSLDLKHIYKVKTDGTEKTIIEADGIKRMMMGKPLLLNVTTMLRQRIVVRDWI